MKCGVYKCIVVCVNQQIQELTNNNSTLKLKLRRVEEDYIKKVVHFSFLRIIG